MMSRCYFTGYTPNLRPGASQGWNIREPILATLKIKDLGSSPKNMEITEKYLENLGSVQCRSPKVSKVSPTFLPLKYWQVPKFRLWSIGKSKAFGHVSTSKGETLGLAGTRRSTHFYALTERVLREVLNSVPDAVPTFTPPAAPKNLIFR